MNHSLINTHEHTITAEDTMELLVKGNLTHELRFKIENVESVDLSPLTVTNSRTSVIVSKNRTLVSETYYDEGRDEVWATNMGESWGSKKRALHVIVYSKERIKDPSMHIEFVTSRVKYAEDILDDHIEIKFWSNDGHGGIYTERNISVCSWDEIKDNYADAARNEFERIIEKGMDFGSGKLLLWYGEPGVGKTHAIRALARQWSEDISVNYIVDPEQFFTDSKYLMNAMIQEQDHDTKLNIFVLEDAGELLTTDSKDKIGQGLSRLLNILDGLIGQGLNIAILITTNEDITTFHPALIRDGRCFSKVKFELLSSAEANDWLAKHDVDRRVSTPTSLSALYAMLNASDSFSDEQEKLEPVGTGVYL